MSDPLDADYESQTAGYFSPVPVDSDEAYQSMVDLEIEAENE